MLPLSSFRITTAGQGKALWWSCPFGQPTYRSWGKFPPLRTRTLTGGGVSPFCCTSCSWPDQWGSPACLLASWCCCLTHRDGFTLSWNGWITVAVDVTLRGRAVCTTGCFTHLVHISIYSICVVAAAFCASRVVVM